MGHATPEGKAGCQGQAKAWARVAQDGAAKGVCSAGRLGCGRENPCQRFLEIQVQGSDFFLKEKKKHKVPSVIEFSPTHLPTHQPGSLQKVRGTHHCISGGAGCPVLCWFISWSMGTVNLTLREDLWGTPTSKNSMSYDVTQKPN